MKLFIYFLITFPLISIFNLFAEIVVDNRSKEKSLKWEKIKNNNNKKKTIIWKSYKDDKFYFKKEKLKKNSDLKFDGSFQEGKDSVITNINSVIPLNNFLQQGSYQINIDWKSSFDGGVSGGTGQQNPSFLIDYGLTDKSLVSFYLTGADDDLYNLINEEKSPYYWQSYALSYRKNLFNDQGSNLSLSFVSTIEYWRIASGSDNVKSIFNEKNSNVGKDKFENIVGALSFPLTKEINNNLLFAIVPGMTFLPDKLGSRNNGKNAYGNNFYLGTGIILDLTDDLKFLGSYTTPFGPGSNYFNNSLQYSNKSIYSYGLNWNINQRIGIEGKITNSYGSSPSTGILTIPSDNKPLYSANLKYSPYGNDDKLKPLSNKNRLVSHGGITVNNALIQDYGKSHGNLNYDLNGNLFFSYKYLLSNIFQLEFIDVGTFKKIRSSNKNRDIRNIYLEEDTLNFRIGGKLLIFSPQKNDSLWTSIRTSFGRNDKTNQGYIYTELINTINLKDWLSLNASTKYFYSGEESFGALGLSKYIKVSNNFQIIPEVNTLLKQDSEFNSTLALRYAYNPGTSIDLYYSNAIGTQDLGQVLKGDNRFGIRLNFLF
tara:strand:- start:2759 stop:4552 length:1794 start_codon:yes stop_codon:yes gene_type:complete